ncbi:electron transfer flavoprotein, beta subunit [Ochromonadaceae sp. CCMP2298]|nr:electron transfer flavoprotein, beta subunit [Ochromonadaceae sp. CCMP2298]
MRVIVGVKRVVDYAVKVRVLADKTGVDLNNVKMSLNPFCEIAIEEAIRLKEKKMVTEIIAVSIGSKTSQETLRTALAMGADKGIHIETSKRTDQEVQPLDVAKVLKFLAERDAADMVIVGKQSIDADSCQTGQMTAALLGWAQCTFASSVEVEGKTLKVSRETDAGSEKLLIQLPAVITADLRLNEPRYATLPNIMKAKKKPIEVLSPADVGLDFAPQNAVVSVEEPPVRAAGIMVSDVDELIGHLKNTAKVI